MMATHASTPPSPVRPFAAALDGAVWLWGKHSHAVTLTGSLLLGLGITADVVMGSILLHRQHHYGAEMWLLLGSFLAAAVALAVTLANRVKPAVAHWGGHQWDDAGRLPVVEETEVVPTVKLFPAVT